MVGGIENIPARVEMQKQPGGTDTGNQTLNERADRVNNSQEKAEQEFCSTLSSFSKEKKTQTEIRRLHRSLQACKIKLMNDRVAWGTFTIQEFQV